MTLDFKRCRIVAYRVYTSHCKPAVNDRMSVDGFTFLWARRIFDMDLGGSMKADMTCIIREEICIARPILNGFLTKWRGFRRLVFDGIVKKP